MDLGKCLWRLVLLIVVVFMIVAGYRLSGLFLKSQTLGPAIIAEVSLLDGTVLTLDQSILDQDLLTVSAAREDVSMTWDALAATTQLVIDPRKLPPSTSSPIPFKWLVAVPRKSGVEMKFCLALPESPRSECYRFTRSATAPQSPTTPTVDPVQDDSLSLSYPRPLISVDDFSEDTVSFFVTLEPYNDEARNTVNPSKLSLRIIAAGLKKGDQHRLNDYPFIHLFLDRGTPVTIEFLDQRTGQDAVYEVLTLPSLVEGATPLRNASAVPTDIPPRGSIPTLSFRWQGTAMTSVDTASQIARDLSSVGRDFSTRIRVHSGFDEPVKVMVQLLENSTTISHTIAPHSTGEVLFNIKNLTYGKYRLQLNAVLPYGQKTADVIIPFQYLPSSWF